MRDSDTLPRHVSETVTVTCDTPCEGLLAELELFEEVWELRLHGVVTHAALDQVGIRACLIIDF